MIIVSEYGEVVSLREEELLNIVNVKGQEELKKLIEDLEKIYFVRYSEPLKLTGVYDDRFK